MDPALASRYRKSDAMLIRRRQNDFAAVLGHRFGGVLDEVQKDLHESVAVTVDRRQRRVVFLDEADMPAEAALRNPAHALQHLMDIDRGPGERALVRED